MKRASFIAGAAAFALYLLAAPSVSSEGDGGEFTVMLAVLGLPHPTGYPIYTLTGHAFVVVLHALGVGWARAAIAWSALFGGVAVALLHAAATRLSGSWRAALVPAVIFAIDPVWTFDTTHAEVYAMHLAWVGAAALLFEALMREGKGTDGRAAAWGVLGGLGGAHHVTSALAFLILSGFLALRLQKAAQLKARVVVIAVLAAFVPLSSYLFVAYRAWHPAVAQWPLLEPSWSSVRDHITGAVYGHYLGSFAPSQTQELLLANGMWPVLIPAIAIIALATIYDKARRLTWGGLLAASLGLLIHAFSYSVPDPSSYFLTPLAFCLLATAPAARWLWSSFGGKLALGVVTVALCTALPAWLGALRDRRMIMEGNDANLRSMWASIPFEHAIVLFPDDMHWKLRELQLLEGDKPGLDVISTPMLPHPVMRRIFEQRFGFDPLGEGPMAPPNPALIVESVDKDGTLAAMHAAIAARAKLPVIIFDAAKSSVRLVKR